MMEEGKFREDLFYRLSVFPIRIPPLRERMEDIPDLADALVRRYAAEGGRGPRRLSRQAVARLLQHEWPGNVRELENVLRRTVLMTPGDTIGPEDLPLGPSHGPRGEALLARLKTRVKESLRPRDEIALRLALDRGKFTLRDYLDATRISKATATRDLRHLVTLKILVRRGSTSSACYQLAPRLANDD
jgi:DNA-binding NtrC family response regulator